MLAVVVVVSVVWVVFRTVEQAQAPNQWVAHTQEVLATVETVLATAVDAEDAVRSFVPSSWGLKRSARSIERNARPPPMSISWRR